METITSTKIKRHREAVLLGALLLNKGYKITENYEEKFVTVNGTNFGIGFNIDGSMEILTNYNRDGAWVGLRSGEAYKDLVKVANSVVAKIKWAERQNAN